MQEEALSPSNDSIFTQNKKPINIESTSIESDKSKRSNRQKIPDIQIKVGVQNNHYSFFNTINESEEDDDNLVTVIGLNNNKRMLPLSQPLGFKFK